MSIVVLANKGIAQVGTPLELCELPENEFVARLICTPAMNLLPGKISETGERTIYALWQPPAKALEPDRPSVSSGLFLPLSDFVSVSGMTAIYPLVSMPKTQSVKEING